MDCYTLWEEEEGLRAAREFMESAQRPVILHISDTFIGCYNMAKRILDIVRPDLTIHTGDMADDFKAGRLEEHVPGYRAHVPGLIAYMEEKSDRVWLTPGNNDVADVLNAHGENTTVWPNGARTEAFGVKMELDHYPIPITRDVDFAIYGHGPTDDLRYPLPDVPGEETVYLNGNFFWTIIEAKTKRFIRIPYRWPGQYRRVFIAAGEADFADRRARNRARYVAKALGERRFNGTIAYTAAPGAKETALDIAQTLGLDDIAAFDDLRALDLPLDTLLEKPDDYLLVGSAEQAQAATELMLSKCRLQPQAPQSVPGSLSVFRIVKYIGTVCHPLQLNACTHIPMFLL